MTTETEITAPLEQVPLKCIDICFLFHRKYVGTILGKGGENIMKMRKDFNAKIFLADCRGPERTLRVEIANDQFQAFLRKIISMLQDYNTSDDQHPTYDIRLLFHHDFLGHIIGKEGSIIKALKEKTGCYINVLRAYCPGSTERVVQICGNLNSILNCITEIVDSISDAPIRSHKALYDPNNHDFNYSLLYGGYCSNSAYRKVKAGIRPSSNTNQSHPRSNFKQKLASNTNDCQSPTIDDSAKIQSTKKSEQDNEVFIFSCNVAPIFSENSEEGTVDITIPSKYIGPIIGLRGTNIRKMRDESGAKIYIDQPGNSERTITITGTLGRIVVAQRLLQENVRKHSQK